MIDTGELAQFRYREQDSPEEGVEDICIGEASVEDS